jgi:hypothetical protein
MKAVGPDNIAGKIPTENADICSDILTIIHKKSVETGEVPLDWNHAMLFLLDLYARLLHF